MPRVSLSGGDQPIELEYASHGTHSDPLLVLIRGLGTQMIEWPSEFITSLCAKQLRVVTFDNRDVGLSTKCTQDYSLSDMAADVVGLIDHLGAERAHIFGISLGGMVAQLLGIEHGDRVACLFSVMSGSGNPDVPTVSAEMLPLLSERAEGREASIALTAARKVTFGSPGYPETEEVRLAQATAAYDRCYCPEGVARQMQAANSDGSRVERLKTITVPTMVIHGVDDALVNIAAGEDTARHIPGATMERIEGMGHNVPAALAPKLADLVGGFIAAH